MKSFKLRVISSSEVRSLLAYADCVAAVQDAMQRVSAGGALMPLRQIMALPNGAGALGMMPGYLADPEHFGIKLLSLFPGNASRGLSSHMGLYLLNDARTGQPLALLEAGALTAIRTAAASVVATRALARPASTALAIIGTGEEACSHVEAFQAVRPFARVLVWGRNSDAARAFAGRYDGLGGARVQVAGSVQEALAHADVVCTVTSASEPVLHGADVRPGTHLCLVGSSVARYREVDDDCVAMSRYFVDYRASAMAQAGELLHAIGTGRITERHVIAEIGDVLAGRTVGRESAGDVTLYKSLGIAAQDIVAASLVYERAVARGVGVVVEV